MECIWEMKQSLKKLVKDERSNMQPVVRRLIEKIFGYYYLFEKFGRRQQKLQFYRILREIKQELNVNLGIGSNFTILIAEAYDLIIFSVFQDDYLDQIKNFVRGKDVLNEVLANLISSVIDENYGLISWKYDFFWDCCRNILKVDSSFRPLFYYIFSKVQNYQELSNCSIISGKHFPKFFSYFYGISKNSKKFYLLPRFSSVSQPNPQLFLKIKVDNLKNPFVIERTYTCIKNSPFYTLGNSDEFDINLNEALGHEISFSCLLLLKQDSLFVLNFLSKSRIRVKLMPNIKYLMHPDDEYQLGKLGLKVSKIEYFNDKDNEQLKSKANFKITKNEDVIKDNVVAESESRRFVFGTSTGNVHVNEILSSNEGVSKEHLEVTFDRGEWFLTDLKSKNGTYYIPLSVKDAKLTTPFSTIPEYSSPVQLCLQEFIIKIYFERV